VIHVAGGVYFERCLFPPWNQLYGSGGRAAALIAQSGTAPTLHTYLSKPAESRFQLIAATYGFDLAATESVATYGFDYAHPFAAPSIIPNRPTSTQPAIRVDGEAVLRFGMMEGDAIVNAATAVYDPQSAVAPQTFALNGSEAKRLALVLNAHEASLLCGNRNMAKVGHDLVRSADVVVIKGGMSGAIVATKSRSDKVPAYHAEGAFTIGSGDVFSGVFFYFWATQGYDAFDSANLASLAVASYVESQALPPLDKRSLEAPKRSPVQADAGAKVYLAGPFFNLSQRWLVTEARMALASLGLEVLSPFHDVGIGDADDVAPKDIEMLRKADKIFAVLEGGDAGTLFEVGYARSLGKPVVCYAQTLTDDQLKMYRGTGCTIVNDFAYAVSITAQK